MRTLQRSREPRLITHASGNLSRVRPGALCLPESEGERSGMSKSMAMKFVVAFATGHLLGAMCFGQAAIELSRSVGPPTTQTLVSGQDFLPNASVTLYFDSTQIEKTSTNSTGSFSDVSFQIPASATPGSHRIGAVGPGSGDRAKAKFVVQTDWPQPNFDAAGSRFNPYENVLSPTNVGGLTQIFSFTASVAVSPPLVAGGAVFFNSDDGNLYALNAATGAVLWQRSLGVTSSYPLPTVGNGMVYELAEFQLYGIDAKTGQIAWSSYVGEQVSSIVVSDSTVYVTAYAVTGYDLFEFTLDGFLLGETFIWGTPSLSPASIANGTIYSGAGNGITSDLLAVANGYDFGLKLWQYPIAVDGYPAVVNGAVYAGSSDGNVYALGSTTGSLLWKYTTGGEIFNPPAIGYGVVYIGSDDQILYALNSKTGAPLWQFAADASAAAVANGVVYVGTNSGDICALSARTGAVLFQHAAGQNYGVSWPVVANGVVYFSSGANFYAFGLPQQAPPRLRQDLTVSSEH